MQSRGAVVSKIVILFLSAVFGVSSVRGVEPNDTLSACYVFTELESPALELLSKSTRLDMLAYADEGRQYDALNEMKGIANLETLEDKYAKVKVSGVSKVEIMTLPYKKGGAAALIYTVGSEGAESELLMYDSQLRPLNADKFFTPPVLKDFVAPEYQKDKKVLAELGQLLPFIASRYEFEPSTGNLRACLSVKDIAGEEDYAKALPYLSDGTGDKPRVLIYEWNGKKFVLRRE